MAFDFSSADLSLIDVFGVDASYQHQSGGSPVSVRGIFAPPALAEEMMPDRGVSVIRFFIRYSDLSPAPKRGDSVIIEQSTYMVMEADVDSAGGAMLKLRKNTS